MTHPNQPLLQELARTKAVRGYGWLGTIERNEQAVAHLAKYGDGA